MFCRMQIRLQSSLGNQRRLLLVLCSDLSRLAPEIVVGGSGEVLLLDLSGRRASTVLVDGLLSLGGVLLGQALDSLGSIGGLLAGDIPELSSLLAGKAPALLELGINDLLVLEIDERAEEGNDSTDEGKTPHGNELDYLLARGSNL